MRLFAIAGMVSMLGLASAAAAPQSFRSSAGNLTVETVARGLVNPWALAFLPDGRMLVTERPGRLRIVGKDGKLSPALTGMPRVFARGQGGLHDVMLDRDYAQNSTIYFCFAQPANGGGRTALARAKLIDEATPRLDDVKLIFQQEGPLSSGNHFGCRIAQALDGNLFLTLGEHFTTRDQAQNLGNHLGKIVRIKPDGSVPPDNPFVNRAGAKPEIWSYGHRNIQGLAVHPETGVLWEGEFGPRGGDEINIPEPDRNYGWPLVSWGDHYDGRKIPRPPTRPDLADAIHHWTPSISF